MSNVHRGNDKERTINLCWTVSLDYFERAPSWHERTSGDVRNLVAQNGRCMARGPVVLPIGQGFLQRCRICRPVHLRSNRAVYPRQIAPACIGQALSGQTYLAAGHQIGGVQAGTLTLVMNHAGRHRSIETDFTRGTFGSNYLSNRPPTINRTLGCVLIGDWNDADWLRSRVSFGGHAS
jgi:hypothetical protein